MIKQKMFSKNVENRISEASNLAQIEPDQNPFILFYFIFHGQSSL